MLHTQTLLNGITLHQETLKKSHPIYMALDEEDIKNVNGTTRKLAREVTIICAI
jgi:hypothetical protein